MFAFWSAFCPHDVLIQFVFWLPLSVRHIMHSLSLYICVVNLSVLMYWSPMSAFVSTYAALPIRPIPFASIILIDCCCLKKWGSRYRQRGLFNDRYRPPALSEGWRTRKVKSLGSRRRSGGKPSWSDRSISSWLSSLKTTSGSATVDVD
jgi:hypothetical protein